MKKTIKRSQLLQLIKEEIGHMNITKTKKSVDKDNLRNLIKECLTEVISEHVKHDKLQLKENYSHNDYGAISGLLERFGWAYTDAYPVTNRRTGQKGTRYIIEAYPNNLDKIKPASVDILKSGMTKLLGSENVIFSEGQSTSAPELKNLSMVIINS